MRSTKNMTTIDLIAIHKGVHNRKIHDLVEDILVHRAAWHDDTEALVYLEGCFGITSDAN